MKFVGLFLVSLVCAGFAERTVLLHATSPPPGWELIGAPLSGDEIPFFIALRQQNLNRLKTAFESVSDPLHVSYGEYYTIERIRALLSPLPSATTAVFDMLATGISCENWGDALKCVGKVAAIEATFQTTLRTVKHVESGMSLVRQIGDFSIPNTVADVVEFVTPFSQYVAPIRQRPRKTSASAAAFTVVPETLTRMYNISLKGSSNSSQGAVEFGEADWMYLDSDLQQFAGLTNTVINITKSFGPPTQPSDLLSIEATLDVQYVGAVGQGNVNWYWKETQWMFGFVQNLQNASSRPNVLSLSYAWSEEEQCIGLTDQLVCQQLKLNNQQYVERINTEFMKIGLLGITITVASGDSGCHGRTDEDCFLGKGKRMFPDYPACSPYVLSVGGTALQNPVSQNPTLPVCTGHNIQCATGGTDVTATTEKQVAEIVSGGGFSNYAPRPSYQDAFVTSYLDKAKKSLPPAKDFVAQNRGFPDVSALAHAYYIQAQGVVNMVDGTSCASPVWTGIIALINSHRLALGRPLVGFANPLLYQVYNLTNGAAFNDITVGDNRCSEDGCHCPDGFPAIQGWDAATGLGTPNVGKIVAAIDRLDALREQKKRAHRV